MAKLSPDELADILKSFYKMHDEDGQLTGGDVR